MKKTYERPELQMLSFDVDDVITASSSTAEQPAHLDNPTGGVNWQVPGLGIDWA